MRHAIELAVLLGVKRVVTMSGLPAAHAGGTLPAWSVLPWDSAYLDARDYQWQEVAIPFWTEIEAVAAENDVRVAIEMHPHNLVFNPATMKRLVERTNATHLGAEMDPSHLFWQHIDPIRAVEDLGDLVFFADNRHVSHVGIYVGKRRFVHAPNSGGTVRLDSLDGAWWREHFVYGKRVL